MDEVRALVNATSADSDYVFISYSHKDKKTVMEDLQELAKNGAVFWYDDGLASGEDWEKNVEKVLNSPHCKGMIFYVSKNFLSSKAIIKEVNLLNAKLKRNPNFKYIPIFITIKSVFAALKELDVSEEAFLTLLNTFPSNLIYHTKTYNKFKHIEKLIGELNSLGVVQSRYVYDSNSHFKTEKVIIDGIKGLKLIAYEGMERNLLIPTFINGNKIISIDHDCFHGNNSLESIILPEGIIEVSDMAFKESTVLKFVSFPTTLEYIGYEAFRDCQMLETIIFPTNVKHIGDYCFYCCHALKNVIFNSSTKVNIGFGAFSECIGLKELQLPKMINEIGSYCFNGCTSIESVELPQTLDIVGDYIFLNCINLKNLYIKSEKFFALGNNLENCISLKQITFSTKNHLLFSCNEEWHRLKNLFTIKLSTPQKLHVYDSHIYWEEVDNSDVYEVNINGKILTVKSANNIPFNFEDDNIYTLSLKAFSSSSDYKPSDSSEQIIYECNLKQFDIDENEKKIIRYKKHGEKRVFIPDGIKIIGKNAFESAYDLEEIIFSSDIETIEEEAFIRCRHLKMIDFNDKLREIKSSAFAYCNDLESVTFPQQLSKLGEYCFACCDELKSIDFSKSIIAELPLRCFYRCIKLKHIFWNDSIKIFGDSTFRGCTVCEFTSLPPNLESIESTVFSFNTGYRRVNLPNTVKSIANDFLWYTVNVEEVIIENSKYFFTDNGVLFNRDGSLIYYPVNKKPLNYTLPKTCHTILPTSITDCVFLETIDLNSVETIEQNNFVKCKKLKKVILGDNLHTVQTNCFKDCNALKEIIISSDSLPEVSSNCFTNCHEDLTIYMNDDLLTKVKRNSSWKKLLRNLAEMQCSISFKTLKNL